MHKPTLGFKGSFVKRARAQRTILARGERGFPSGDSRFLPEMPTIRERHWYLLLANLIGFLGRDSAHLNTPLLESGLTSILGLG
jgi:hypothetical protein